MFKLALFALGLAVQVFAQNYEVGAIGGYGFSPDITAKRSTGSVDTGFRPGAVMGAYVGEDSHRYWGGEARYLYRLSDLKLAANNVDVRFGGGTHIVEANFLGYFRARGASLRPFISFGGGIKVIQGTGRESAAQPLGQYIGLTATKEVLPVAGVGFGAKWTLAKSVRLRVEVRDYLSPVPSKVLAPAPGTTLGSLLHDVIGMVAVGYSW